MCHLPSWSSQEIPGDLWLLEATKAAQHQPRDSKDESGADRSWKWVFSASLSLQYPGPVLAGINLWSQREVVGTLSCVRVPCLVPLVICPLFCHFQSSLPCFGLLVLAASCPPGLTGKHVPGLQVMLDRGFRAP